MTVLECWCPKCGEGQMEKILDESFEKKIALDDWIETEVECNKCGEKNKVDDIIELIPTSFNITSRKNIDNYKKDSSMKNHLEK